MSGVVPIITFSASITWFVITSSIVLNGVKILILHFTSKYNLCRVWLIPASLSSLLKSVSTSPTLSILKLIIGPLPG